ncbi:hypothetical protein BUALT_Bualt02G0077100 [Buddleja alternifolia]|uniref:Zinc finger PMZ-type domain-containing protein n=1 Tax=Buddleja alternifolia TaxID=168488 RepID=A0AAV6Y518_9LAMI|nr:hypothetical protein BUALT_Bualt02G0077100 [Buddleja alternifolia]
MKKPFVLDNNFNEVNENNDFNENVVNNEFTEVNENSDLQTETGVNNDFIEVNENFDLNAEIDVIIELNEVNENTDFNVENDVNIDLHELNENTDFNVENDINNDLHELNESGGNVETDNSNGERVNENVNNEGLGEGVNGNVSEYPEDGLETSVTETEGEAEGEDGFFRENGMGNEVNEREGFDSTFDGNVEAESESDSYDISDCPSWMLEDLEGREDDDIFATRPLNHSLCNKIYKAKYKGQELKRLFWKSASTYNVRTKCDVIVNNISESFNSYILEARKLPIMDMFEAIRRKCMNRIQVKKAGMEKYQKVVCSNILNRIEKQRYEGRHCCLSLAGDDKFEVRHFMHNHIVYLNERHCSCGMFQLCGFPCCYAISCINEHRLDIDDFVDDYFKKDTYLRVYNHMVNPVPGMHDFEESNLGVIDPPNVKVRMGRQKKKRIRDGSDRRDPTENPRQREGPPPNAPVASMNNEHTGPSQAPHASQTSASTSHESTQASSCIPARPRARKQQIPQPRRPQNQTPAPTVPQRNAALERLKRRMQPSLPRSQNKTHSSAPMPSNPSKRQCCTNSSQNAGSNQGGNVKDPKTKKK